MSLFSLFNKKPKKTASVPVQPKRLENEYEFIVHCDRSDSALLHYQKANTDPDDMYNGMSMKEFKEDGVSGDKVYKYPPLDVPVKLSAFIGEDGSVEISGIIVDGYDDILVGKAAKTKGKKILKILQEEKPKITAVLSGGYYWKIEQSGYVNDDWQEDYKMIVTLQW